MPADLCKCGHPQAWHSDIDRECCVGTIINCRNELCLCQRFSPLPTQTLVELYSRAVRRATVGGRLLDATGWEDMR